MSPIEIEDGERDRRYRDRLDRKSIEANYVYKLQLCNLYTEFNPIPSILSYPLSYPVASMGK